MVKKFFTDRCFTQKSCQVHVVVSDHLGFTFWKVAYGRFNCSQINTVVGGGGSIMV